MRWWRHSGGLFARLAAVLIVAALTQFAASTVLFEQAELVSADDAEIAHAAYALETAARALDALAAGQRPAVALALSGPQLDVRWPATERTEGTEAGPFIAAAPALAGRALAVGTVGTSYRGSARLSDGSRFDFSLPRPADVIPAFWNTLTSVGLLSAFVLIAALTVARTLAAPLRALARAADAIGGGPAVPVAVGGPRELRRVAEAFNAMQARIDRLIADRTQALAAVSHDLRTPIARMRLRCGLFPDTEDGRALDADLGEMEGMIASLSAYLRGEADPEKARRIDVAAMLQTLVDDAADAGQRARYDGPEHHVRVLRPLAVKRALANIVNNAVIHGGRADVVLRPAVRPGAPTVITVEDDGPGIPDEHLARVFEPFHRVNAARTAGAGGMGLGLSIARQAIGRENGSISLANRAEGGLRVTIALP